MVERAYCLDPRTIDCETRHGKGCEILHGLEDGAKVVLNGREVDLGIIVLVTFPGSWRLRRRILEVSSFEFLGDITGTKEEMSLR